MKDLVQIIECRNKDIRDIREQINFIHINPMYDYCECEKTREEHLQACYNTIRIILSEKQALLDTLKMRIEIEQHLVSQAEKQFTLLKT